MTLMMDGRQPTPIELVALLSIIGHAVHSGPGLSFPISVMREAGTKALYDAMPIIGEAIDGDNAWYRMVIPPDGFVHGSYLRRAT